MKNYQEQYAIALSICSSPTNNQIWNFISSYSAYDAYQKIFSKRKLETQNYIRSVYPGSPNEAAEEIIKHCLSKFIKIITYWDDDYPPLLREISKPPIVLYCKGNLTLNRSVAIVGTRKTDKRSSDIARRISSELSQSGFTIVSGMAIGIDREAHMGVLKNNGSTVGVLANGIDVVYPSFNRDIYSAIQSSKKSSLISEYPPGIHAGKWTFVRRNRIISGLSLGTLVVKAAEKSGALITAQYSLEQNREVFACPGYAFDKSYSGCHNLIKNGAVIVSETEDIIRELSDYEERVNVINHKPEIVKKTKIVKAKDSPDVSNVMVKKILPEEKYLADSVERKVLNIISNGETNIDSIVRLIKHNTNEVNEALIMLELSNDITRDGNVISKF